MPGLRATSIDSIAFEYQLSDLKFFVRLALLRFVSFHFFSFCLSSFWCDGTYSHSCMHETPPLLVNSQRLH